MDVESNPAASRETGRQADLSRREFIKKSGKAAYAAPTLTLLASVPATAALPSQPPPPPNSAPMAPAPPGL